MHACSSIPQTIHLLNSGNVLQVGDLVDFAQQVQSQSAGVPMFVGGQSMGGMVSCLAALRRPDLFAGLLLCSAAIDVERTLVMR